MGIGELVERWACAKRGARLDLYFGGRVFGGRPGESPQTLKALQRAGPELILEFGTTERLVVLEPAGVSLGDGGSLIVLEASEVRFGWHYYGRPQLPENWCEEIYRPAGDGLLLVRTGPLLPGTERFSAGGEPILKIEESR